MLDELPSLELAGSAVALVLVVRAVLLARGRGLVRGRARVESARARDLVGLALLVGAVVYAFRSGRASSWFVAAAALATVAQLTGFYLRTRARRRLAEGDSGSDLPSQTGDDELEDEPPNGCPQCGHAELIELVDAARLLGGLNQHSPVSALVCPRCGTLTGQVEDPQKIPVGPEHGTALWRSSPGDGQEALEDPTEHDG